MSSQLNSVRSFSRKYRKDFGAVLGGAIIIVFVICAVFAPYISPYNPKTPSFTSILAPPSAAHLFGTDNLGRDVLSNVIWGARISLEVGVLSGVLMLLIGMATGIAAGFFRRLDKVVMSFTDSALITLVTCGQAVAPMTRMTSGMLDPKRATITRISGTIGIIRTDQLGFHAIHVVELLAQRRLVASCLPRIGNISCQPRILSHR